MKEVAAALAAATGAVSRAAGAARQALEALRFRSGQKRGARLITAAPGQADGESARQPASGSSGWSNSTGPAPAPRATTVGRPVLENASVLLSLRPQGAEVLCDQPRWGRNHGALRRAALTVELKRPREASVARSRPQWNPRAEGEIRCPPSPSPLPGRKVRHLRAQHR